jgi:hypothetical protein
MASSCWGRQWSEVVSEYLQIPFNSMQIGGALSTYTEVVNDFSLLTIEESS